MRAATGAVAAASSIYVAFGQRPCMSFSAARSLPVSASAKPGKSARCDDHQRRAERRGVEAVAQLQAFAAGFPFAGRHRFVRHEQIVQPAGAGQPDFVGRVQHARGIAQDLARMVERQRGRNSFGVSPAQRRNR